LNKRRARVYGISPGIYDPGSYNAITDVAGVAVGYYTLIEGKTYEREQRPFCPMGETCFKSEFPPAWL
jgi:D-aminopeptidase